MEHTHSTDTFTAGVQCDLLIEEQASGVFWLLRECPDGHGRLQLELLGVYFTVEAARFAAHTNPFPPGGVPWIPNHLVKITDWMTRWDKATAV